MNQRREILRKLTGLRNDDSKLRPPFFKDKEDFSLCLDCEEKFCKFACEENLIFIKDGKPEIKFGENYCTYCAKCANSCPKNVLNLENQNSINAKIFIDIQACFSWNKVVCYTCKEACPKNAIKFFGLFRAVVSEDCNSCGACLQVCQNNAIKFKIEEI